MSSLNGHVARVRQLMEWHRSYLDAFLSLRCREETHLDFYTMRHLCAGYIEWCAIASVATVANLTKRKWNLTAITFESVVADALKYAEKKPVGREKLVPTLLIYSFILNHYLQRFHGTSQILNNDIEYSLRTGILLLGKAEAQDIATLTEPHLTEASLSIVQDATNSTREGRELPPENVETLDAVILRVKQQLAAEAAEASRIVAKAAEASRIAAKAKRTHPQRPQLKIESEKKPEESRPSADVDEKHQRQSMSEEHKPATTLRPQLNLCPACSGLGGRTCLACGGRGYQSYSRTRTRWDNRVEYFQENITCSFCRGGRVTCTSCGGNGRVVELK